MSCFFDLIIMDFDSIMSSCGQSVNEISLTGRQGGQGNVYGKQHSTDSRDPEVCPVPSRGQKAQAAPADDSAAHHAVHHLQVGPPLRRPAGFQELQDFEGY